MNLSDVFKFTQGLGQKGHQIGRKVGDAIELLTLGMINLDGRLIRHLVIEDGVEGASTAKHKVEFSFYNLNDGIPTRIPNDLFGLIECKKVGVEQTIKQSFKAWKSQPRNRRDFHLTEGYQFTISAPDRANRWSVEILGSLEGESNINLTVTKLGVGVEDMRTSYQFNTTPDSQLLIAVDVNSELHILGPDAFLSSIVPSINKCVVVQIESLVENKVKVINVNESLPGPQTPEKAKQASFVSLDVRKKVLGHFDQTDNKSFVSVLVIGEASHWEEKSRAMVRLCNDYNLIIPDNILVHLFVKFEEQFGSGYQELITKTSYRDSLPVRNLVMEVIEHFNRNILMDMESERFVKFKCREDNGINKLTLEFLD